MQTPDPWAEERAKIVAKYETGRGEGAQIDPWEDPNFSYYTAIDYHGFIHELELSPQLKIQDDKIRKHDVEREARWAKMTNEKSKNKYFHNGRATQKLVRRIYKGIPKIFRDKWWCKMLNLDVVKAQQKGIYKKMLDVALLHSPDIRQIDLDVNRTFRNTFLFRERYGYRQKALFNVLAAYSIYNTEVGYCQGMSQLAGLMLMYLIEEEDAFWALSQMMTSPHMRMHGFFVPEFPKLIRFFTHHETILSKLQKQLFRHLEEEMINTSTYALKWFMQCFLDRVPMSLCLRLWDVYLLDGEHVLIAMAYTIFKLHKKRLLRMDQNQILIFFQSELAENFLYEDDVVMSALKDSMEELAKAGFLKLPPPDPKEYPTRPFGFRPAVREITDRHIQQADPGAVVRRSMRRKSRNSAAPSKSALEHSKTSDSGNNEATNSYHSNNNNTLSPPDFVKSTSAVPVSSAKSNISLPQNYPSRQTQNEASLATGKAVSMPLVQPTNSRPNSDIINPVVANNGVSQSSPRIRPVSVAGNTPYVVTNGHEDKLQSKPVLSNGDVSSRHVTSSNDKTHSSPSIVIRQVPKDKVPITVNGSVGHAPSRSYWTSSLDSSKLECDRFPSEIHAKHRITSAPSVEEVIDL